MDARRSGVGWKVSTLKPLKLCVSTVKPYKRAHQARAEPLRASYGPRHTPAVARTAPVGPMLDRSYCVVHTLPRMRVEYLCVTHI